MTGAISSVLIATAQSIAKVFVVGAAGYFAVKCPKHKPLLPVESVSMFARFVFTALQIPLIYTSIAQSITPASIGRYWFAIVGSFAELIVSYISATALSYFIPVNNFDFTVLRYAVVFPNVISLPILISQSLCEYEIVYEVFGNEGGIDKVKNCVTESNTMIFCFYLGWVFTFWAVGYPALLRAARKGKKTKVKKQIMHSNQNKSISSEPSETSHLLVITKDSNGKRVDEENCIETATINSKDTSDSTASLSNQGTDGEIEEEDDDECCDMAAFCTAIKKSFVEPPIIAMYLGFATGFIPPLQHALFSPSGPIRFVGSALETLGVSSMALKTMVVAASLILPTTTMKPTQDDNKSRSNFLTLEEAPQKTESIITESNRPRTKQEMMNLHIWFNISRLILAPALIVLMIASLKCSGMISGVPGLAHLIIIIDTAVPGALIVAVVLKTEPDLQESAGLVAKVYFVNYILSIFTICVWVAIGLYITLPNEDGYEFCSA